MGDHVHHAQEAFRNYVVGVKPRAVFGVGPHPDLSYAVGLVEQELAHVFDPKSGLQPGCIGFFESDCSIRKMIGSTC